MIKIKNLLLVTLFIAMLTILYSVKAQAEENLLINGNAENGMEGWIDPDNLWFPSNEITPYEGTTFFWPSKAGCEYSHIYQDVDISSYPAGTWVELTGYLANWDQYPNDEATLELDFLNAKGEIIATRISSQRNAEWKKHSIQESIPANSYTARIRLNAQRYIGSDNDAYFDNLSFVVMDGTFNIVYLSGKTKIAKAGDQIQLTANNGVSTKASDFNWYSSYDSIATVDANGLVTFVTTWTGTENEVTITAEDKETGITETYYFNSSIITKSPAPGQTTGLKKSKVTKTTITIKWTEVKKATGYYIYQYNSSTKKWVKVKTVAGESSVKISKLKAGITYKFKVIAYIKYGTVPYTGVASKVLSIKTAK